MKESFKQQSSIIPPIAMKCYLRGQQTANLSSGSTLQENPDGQFSLLTPRPQFILVTVFLHDILKI
jgi:hypothetical protein